jgi:hypothetical protein
MASEGEIFGNQKEETSPGFWEKLFTRVSWLVAIYLAVNLIYQRAYYAYYGMSIGMFSVNGELILFHNYFIAIYAVALWAFLVFLPRRASNAIERLFDAGPWLKIDKILGYRLCGIAVSFALTIFDFNFDGLVSLAVSKIYPQYIILLPLISGIFHVLDLIVVFVFFFYFPYRKYSEIRSMGIMQVSPRNRSIAIRYLNLFLVINFMTVLYVFTYMVPHQAGMFVASNDWRNMTQEKIQNVSSLKLSHPACRLAFSPAGPDSYVWLAENHTEQVYYVGGFQENYEVFAIYIPGHPSPNTCLIPSSEVQSLSLLPQGAS